MEAYLAYRWRRSVESLQPTGWRAALSAAAGLLLLLAACSAPVQVDRVDLRSAYDELTAPLCPAISSVKSLARSSAARPCSTTSMRSPKRPLLRCVPRPSPLACSGRTSTRCRR